MPYPLVDLAIIGLIMTVGSVVQGALGFASGLLGVPLLVLSGFSLLEATVINFVSTAVQNISGAVQMAPHYTWREVAWPTALRAVGLPIGIAALDATQNLDQGIVRQIIGAVLLGSVTLIMVIRVRPRDKAPWTWTTTAMLASGFLMGFGAIGGAPMVIYVNSLTWDAAKCRGFLFFCSAVMVPLMAVLLTWKFGVEARPPAVAALIVMPSILVALWVGLRLGKRLNKELFRRITYGLLIAVAIYAMLSPLVFK